MSLDFYLERKTEPRTHTCACGHEHVVLGSDVEEVASFNITHNLGQMADSAGIYDCLWRPEKQDPPIVTASQCVPLLRDGLKRLRNMPAEFKSLSAPNGWGVYEQFVPWVERVLAACEANPDALVRASR